MLHPIINHRICPDDGKMIVEEHIIVSDNLNHDKHAVKSFESASLQELHTNGFEPTHLLQFCDNCAAQYKSKGPFQYLSTSEIPAIRSYFGPNHSKGPSDSATGRVKCAIVWAHNARVCDLKNAKEVYEFLKHKFEEWERQCTRKSKGKCIHFFQKAIYVTDVECTDKIEAITTKGSANFSTVHSTGSPFIVEARNVACLCPNCLFGDPCECPNKHYSGDWIKFNLKTGKKLMILNLSTTTGENIQIKVVCKKPILDQILTLHWMLLTAILMLSSQIKTVLLVTGMLRSLLLMAMLILKHQ